MEFSRNEKAEGGIAKIIRPWLADVQKRLGTEQTNYFLGRDSGGTMPFAR